MMYFDQHKMTAGVLLLCAAVNGETISTYADESCSDLHFTSSGIAGDVSCKHAFTGTCVGDIDADDYLTGARWGTSPMDRNSEEGCIEVEPDVFVVNGKEENLKEHTEGSWNAVKAKFVAQNRHRVVNAGSKRT